MLLRHVQPSFAGGEVSPSLAARIDSAAYHTWLKEAKNFFVHPQGGASNRPGTRYMGTAKYAQSSCRLIPFVVGEEEAYVLELGQGYIRVFTAAGQLQTEEGVVYEIASPYRASDLEAISYTQYDQTLFLAHPDYPVQRLVRVDKGQFFLEEQPIKYGPFMLSNEREDHQVRVYASQETIQTQGVAATLSFSPVIDNRYFVYGYFRDELFFAPHSYGLDVEGLVNAFNTKYARKQFGWVGKNCVPGSHRRRLERQCLETNVPRQFLARTQFCVGATFKWWGERGKYVTHGRSKLYIGK